MARGDITYATYERMRCVRQHKDEVDDTGGRDLTGALVTHDDNQNTDDVCGRTVLTAFSRISMGVAGGGVLNSKGSSAALRQFFIRGASCRFPSDFCREGTGW